MTIINILIVVLWFFLKKHHRILKMQIGLLLVGILIVLMRLLVPFEFSFQKTIGEEYILPRLFSFLFIPFVQIFDRNTYIYHIFLLLWILGIVFFGLRTLLSYIKFKCKIKNEPFVVSKDIIEILEGVRCPQKKISDFKIIKTNLVSVPLLIGFNMPIIILPEIVLSKEELYYILRHEATHYYNHDIWIKMFIELICILYWWNPLIYILKREIDKLIEIRVDIAVTQTFNELERINYLDCLLKIAKGKAPSHSNSFALAFDCRTASVLSQRFHIVLAHNDGHSFNLRRYIFFVTFVIAVMLASLIVIEPYSVDSDTQQNTVVLEDDNSYLIENTSGGFNLYYNNEYFGTVTEIKESYSDLPVYKNYEEVQKYENKK